MKTRISQKKNNDNKKQILSLFCVTLLILSMLGTLVISTVPIGAVIPDDDYENENIEDFTCNPEIELPPYDIIMSSELFPEYWDAMFRVNLSIPNGNGDGVGNIKGWCVEYSVPHNEMPAMVTLYSSYDPPAHLASENWSKVNYILNNPQGNRVDVQRAILYFVNFGSWSYNHEWGPMQGEISDETMSMINNAMEYGDDFCPECGQIMAVISDPVGNYQTMILEAPLCQEPIDDDDDEEDDEPIEDDDDEEEEPIEDNGEEESKKKRIRRITSRARIRTIPIADIAKPYNFTVYDQPITLDGSNSYSPNPDNYIVSYEWNLGDGTMTSGEIITHEYEQAGSYYVSLTVRDNHGTKGIVCETITIEQPNRAPTKPTILGFYEITGGQGYSFAAMSTDPDEDDIQYIFEWGDGSSDTTEFLSLPKGSAVNKIHSWEDPGDYTITVTVTDGELSSSSEVEVQVLPMPMNPLIAYSIIAAVIALGLIAVLYLLKKRSAKPAKQ